MEAAQRTLMSDDAHAYAVLALDVAALRDVLREYSIEARAHREQLERAARIVDATHPKLAAFFLQSAAHALDAEANAAASIEPARAPRDGDADAGALRALNAERARLLCACEAWSHAFDALQKHAAEARSAAARAL
jgi:hypothetical protein